MKVSIIIESWNNCEGYPEDYIEANNVLAVAIDSDVAKTIIGKRKKELLELVKTSDGKCEPIYDEYDTVDLVRISWPNEGKNCPTHTFNYGYEEYSWSIEEHEIQEEP